MKGASLKCMISVGYVVDIFGCCQIFTLNTNIKNIIIKMISKEDRIKRSSLPNGLKENEDEQ